MSSRPTCLILVAACAAGLGCGSAEPAKRKPPPPPPSLRIETPAELIARAKSPASDGKTLYLRSGDFGDVDLRWVRRNRLTLKNYPGERPRLRYLQLRESSGLRFEGLAFRDTIDIQPGDNHGLAFVRNDIGGFTGSGISIREGSRSIQIANNRIHDLRSSNADTSGYGIRVSGAYGPVSRLTIVGNRLTRLRNDAIELGNTSRSLVERNRINRVRNPGAHADPLTVWAGSHHITIRRNVIFDNNQPVYLANTADDVRFENNVVVRGDNWCIQAGLTGSGDEGIHRTVIRNNTIWDCDLGGLVIRGRGSDNVLVNNIIETFGGTRLRRQFKLADYNLIRRGRRLGRHDRRGRPRFTRVGSRHYELAPGSRGIDAGTSRGVPRSDLLERGRVDDLSAHNRGSGPRSFYDIGAYERGGRRR